MDISKVGADNENMTAVIFASVHAELRKLVVKDCLAKGVTMNEIVALALSELYKRPDLAAIPRKRPGVKPKLERMEKHRAK